MNIDDVINILESAPRLGGEIDSPEGTRYIIMSDTLAKLIAGALHNHLYYPKNHVDEGDFYDKP